MARGRLPPTGDYGKQVGDEDAPSLPWSSMQKLADVSAAYPESGPGFDELPSAYTR